MPHLPSAFLYGRVTAHLVGIGIDIAGDGDSDPEADPIEGYLVFKASPVVVTDVTDKMFALPKPFKAILNGGKLYDPDGTEGLTLVATDSPTLNPIDWTWNVSFNLVNANLPGFNFQLQNGTTKDLSELWPVTSSGGTITLVGPAGPRGPAGPAGTGAPYIFTQVSASTVWTISHGLGKFPIVGLVDTANNAMYGDIHYIDLDNLTITFGTALSGTANLL